MAAARIVTLRTRWRPRWQWRLIGWARGVLRWLEAE